MDFCLDDSDLIARKSDLILVTGAGGFIGGHLVADLLRQGYQRIRAIDIKPFNQWYQIFDGVENIRSCKKQRTPVIELFPDTRVETAYGLAYEYSKHGC